MTNEQKLEEINRRILAIRLRGAAEGWTGEQTYHAYKDLLPLEVVLVDYPRSVVNLINCFLYLFPHVHEEPDNLNGWLKNHGYAEISSVSGAEIYVLYIKGNWVHIGRVLDVHTATSKWGREEPVFRHPLALQPLQYDTIEFFRKR